MPGENRNKSIEMLAKEFTAASNQTKELNGIIKDFGGVMETFYEIVDEIDKKMSVKEMSVLTREATKKLENIKNFNEMSLAEHVEKMIDDKVLKSIYQLNKTIKDSKNNNSLKIEREIEEIKKMMNSKSAIQQNETLISPEIKEILLKIDRQTQHSNLGATIHHQQIDHTEEIDALKKLINGLNTKMNYMEKKYKEKIELLEADVMLLKNDM